MNRFLLIAVYGAILAIALTFNFTTCGNGNNMTVRNDSMDENPTSDSDDAARPMIRRSRSRSKSTSPG